LQLILKIFLICLFISSCGNESKNIVNINQDTIAKLSEAEIKAQDSLKREESIAKSDTFPQINYSKIVIENKKHLRKILREWGFSRKNKIKNKVFITLNRKETRYLRVGDTLTVPDTIFENILAYSIFPHYYPEADTIDKLIIISNLFQSYGCYENGKLIRFAACNTGKERTPTFPGRYALVWRDKKRLSSLDSNWVLPYTWNFHRYAGNAFHQFSMPGYAASHSCVRQFMSDARWLYNWGRGVKVREGKQIWLSGTPVIILGVPDYSRKRSGPWTDLKSNKDGRFRLDYNPYDVEEAYIPITQIPEVIAGWIPNRKRYLVAEDTLRARGIISEDVRLIASVDFNKLRREKREKEIADSLKNQKIQIEKDKTDLELIEQQLKDLNTSDSTQKKRFW
jgi:L,D-transpeptidase catalytic domain